MVSLSYLFRWLKWNLKQNIGQNFLVDGTIIDKICNSVNVNDGEKILEIGPGIGYLTKELKKYNTNLIAFEIDKDTKKYLDELEDDKTKIVYEDFLKVNLNDYYNLNDKIHVIENIPYYITTPIIEHVIKSKLNVIDMTLMVQKEVADRLTSDCGNREYGYISVYLNYYFDLKKIVDVDKSCFKPMPKVDSSVISLTRHNKYKVFFKFVSTAFKMKRKNLKNNFKDYNLDIIEKVLSNYKLDLTHRAEELSIDIFIDLYNNIK